MSTLAKPESALKRAKVFCMEKLRKLRFGGGSTKCETEMLNALVKAMLLKDKKQEAVNRLRRDVESFFESTDSPSSESVRLLDCYLIHEETTLAAYKRLVQVCKSVWDGLPTIQAESECPADLRSGVHSLICAAPLYSRDFPELVRLSKFFEKKYGIYFVYEAVLGKEQPEDSVMLNKSELTPFLNGDSILKIISKK